MKQAADELVTSQSLHRVTGKDGLPRGIGPWKASPRLPWWSRAVRSQGELGRGQAPSQALLVFRPPAKALGTSGRSSPARAHRGSASAPGHLLGKTSCLRGSCLRRKCAQHGPREPGARFGTFAWERSENRASIGGGGEGRAGRSGQADSSPPRGWEASDVELGLDVLGLSSAGQGAFLPTL